MAEWKELVLEPEPDRRKEYEQALATLSAPGEDEEWFEDINWP